ncbi:MAG: UDP-3-O-(3-hydroxymyristoyl)glucosamine N-acyltransferase [Akkermansiaceae bacterium]|nr:UDP-3-O-(3-hydroxymyristoyl)glucosamine N-acyltransferase [Akkermansiaceae bacterium]MDP4996393.1 UDP-3-O-(3-hydroxymyristoyl)glucosamine N-acyltransferase [Akkermansiaceae bacterium]
MAISLSLSELADRIDGTIIRGEASSLFTGMASLDAAEPCDISFLGNEKYVPQFLATRAGAVIVPKGHDFPDGSPALIAVGNPTLAFSAVVSHFAAEGVRFTPGIHPSAFVSPTAKIDAEKSSVGPGACILEGAVIGDGTAISANAVIQQDVVIGNDCRIGSNVSVRERCVLGNRVIIQPGAVIGSDGYGYELVDGRHVKIDQVGIVVIGDDVEIGANSTIDRARFGKTVIGDGTKIDNLVQIGHNAIIGKHCLIVSQVGIAGSAIIKDYVTIAAQSGVAGHITIGANSILASRAGVTTSLEGGMVYAGKPAIPMKEDTKIKAHVRRLPKMLDRIKALEKRLPPLES